MSKQWRIENRGALGYHLYDGGRHIAAINLPEDAERIVAALAAAPDPRDAEIERLMHITESMARWLDDCEPDCDRGNPDGGGIYPCDHCTVAKMVTEANSALAALQASPERPAAGEEPPVVAWEMHRDHWRAKGYNIHAYHGYKPGPLPGCNAGAMTSWGGSKIQCSATLDQHCQCGEGDHLAPAVSGAR